MTFGDSVVDGLSVIRAVRGHRCNLSINLIKQRRHFGDVTDIVRRQLRGNDFMRDGVNPEVQLAPPSARPNAVFLIEPFSLAVNLQACAVDKKMQWFRTVKPLKQDCQATTATAQGRVIGDGDIDPEQIGDGSAEDLRSDAAAGGTPGEVRGRSQGRSPNRLAGRPALWSPAHAMPTPPPR